MKQLTTYRSPKGGRTGEDVTMTPEEKYGRVAMFSATLLTMFAISCGSLALWRVGTDLDWTEEFFIGKGFLSHWQVWIGAALATQYMSWRVARYAATLRRRAVEIEPSA